MKRHCRMLLLFVLVVRRRRWRMATFRPIMQLLSGGKGHNSSITTVIMNRDYASNNARSQCNAFKHFPVSRTSTTYHAVRGWIVIQFVMLGCVECGLNCTASWIDECVARWMRGKLETYRIGQFKAFNREIGDFNAKIDFCKRFFYLERSTYTDDIPFNALDWNTKVDEFQFTS